MYSIPDECFSIILGYLFPITLEKDNFEIFYNIQFTSKDFKNNKWIKMISEKSKELYPTYRDYPLKMINLFKSVKIQIKDIPIHEFEDKGRDYFDYIDPNDCKFAIQQIKDTYGRVGIILNLKSKINSNLTNEPIRNTLVLFKRYSYNKDDFRNSWGFRRNGNLKKDCKEYHVQKFHGGNYYQFCDLCPFKDIFVDYNTIYNILNGTDPICELCFDN